MSRQAHGTSSIQYSSSNASSEEDFVRSQPVVLPDVSTHPSIRDDPGAELSLGEPPAPERRKEGNTKKNKSRSSPPTSVTQVGTYIRAINVFFDQKHRNDVFSLGAAPSVQELDAQSAFCGKAVYDRMLAMYLDQSILHIGAVAFADDPYLPSMGIYDAAAQEFDVLTSEELKDTLAFVNHFYKIAHQNNQKSGNHDDFHNFARDKAYVFYYHLWLKHVPNLLCIAGKKNANSAEVVAAAMLEVGRISSKKLSALEEMNAVKRGKASVDRERVLLALMGKYDTSLKRKVEDLDGYTSDMDEEKQVARMVIDLIKKKRIEVIQSLQSSHEPPTA
jgi:hypothetical protein